MQVCLNIFSDFAKYHLTEWTNQKGYGWSPGYTVQTVLMNLVAFLAETAGEQQKTANVSLSKSFTCKDCGHTYSKPFPALDAEQETSGHVEIFCVKVVANILHERTKQNDLIQTVVYQYNVVQVKTCY